MRLNSNIFPRFHRLFPNPHLDPLSKRSSQLGHGGLHLALTLHFQPKRLTSRIGKDAKITIPWRLLRRGGRKLWTRRMTNLLKTTPAAQRRDHQGITIWWMKVNYFVGSVWKNQPILIEMELNFLACIIVILVTLFFFFEFTWIIFHSPPGSLLRSASFHGTEGMGVAGRWPRRPNHLYASEDDGPYSLEEEVSTRYNV